MTLRRSPSQILALCGTATLVGGAATLIDAGCLTSIDLCTILLSRNTPGGTLGFLSAPSAQRGVGVTTFRISSSNGADTSTVNWLAIPKSNNQSDGLNGGGFRKSPSNKFVQRGTATLVGGTVTVTDVAMSAAARIFVMANTFGGTPGKLSAPVASVDAAAGTFVINSDSGADTSTVDWIVVDEPLRFSPSGRLFYQSKNTLVAGDATFSDANPLDEPAAILASIIDVSTPGNLSAPAASRLSGDYLIHSSNSSDVSTVESSVF